MVTVMLMEWKYENHVKILTKSIGNPKANMPSELPKSIFRFKKFILFSGNLEVIL